MAPIRFLPAALALTFLVAHVQSLPHALEDIDTINFALGVESFDVIEHRPHPPGYPVFIAMARLSTAAVGVIAPGLDRTAHASIGLAVWGLLGGVALVWVLRGFWRSLGWAPLTAWFATALAVVSPLFWFTASRPLTDVPALAGAMAVQWGLVRAWSNPGAGASSRVGLSALALAAGLLVGVRTQTLWLTAPLLVWTAVRQWRQRDWTGIGVLVSASAVGCLLWAVPMVMATGGLDRYLAALASQGSDDFAGVEMLATSATSERFSEALRLTFIAPWRVAWLGQLMSVLSIAGLVVVWRSSRPAFGLLLLAFAPYLVFHLAFQEALNIRYALPFVVPMAGLSARALWLLPAKGPHIFGGLVVAATLITAQQSLRSYSGNVPPTFLAFHDAQAALNGAAVAPFVVPHRGLQRVADWYRPEWPELPRIGPREHEWLRAVEHFRSGSTRPVWFLTDRLRTDAVLFDPRSRSVTREFLQTRDVRRLIGQSRQDEVRWWTITPPAWMLGRGWALSKEVSGVTFGDGREPHVMPAEGYLRRDSGAHRLMIGGRHWAGDRDAVIVVDIDGREVARRVVLAAVPFFLHWIDLDAGVLEGADAYATMRVRVEAADGVSPAPRVGLEQFDFAGRGVVMAGFGDGWHEPETEASTGVSWRWAGARATLEVQAAGSDVRIRLAGESPLRYFERPSTVRVSVGDRELTRVVASADFEETVLIPGGLLGGEPARVVIDTDQSFVPAEREGAADRRQLGVRYYRVDAERP